jgi:hypothetical protein
MKQNEKGKTHQTARKHATKRATKMLKNSGKNPTNEQSEKQHFTKHASFCFASFRYSRIFLVFFSPNFPQFCGKQVFKKCETNTTHQKKQKNANMSAKYTILRICYLSKTHFVRDILQKLQVEVVKTKHSCKTSVIET